MPERIQRRRTKGWKMPPNTVYVGRPTKWGNMWRVDKVSGGWDITYNNHKNTAGVIWLTKEKAASRAKELYKADILTREISERIYELRGKDLACWCPLDQPCHADVLLEIANANK